MKKLSTTAEELKSIGLEVDYLVDGVKSECPSQQEWDSGRVILSFGPPVTPLEDREDYKAGVAAEREACAKLVEEQQCDGLSYIDKALVSVASMIRKRSK